MSRFGKSKDQNKGRSEPVKNGRSLRDVVNSKSQGGNQGGHKPPPEHSQLKPSRPAPTPGKYQPVFTAPGLSLPEYVKNQIKKPETTPVPAKPTPPKHAPAQAKQSPQQTKQPPQPRHSPPAQPTKQAKTQHQTPVAPKNKELKHSQQNKQPLHSKNKPQTSPENFKKSNANTVVGTIKRHADGFGFLITDDPKVPDVYISRQDMTDVMTNDRLEVEIRKDSDPKRLSGRVLRVLERAPLVYAGRLKTDSRGRLYIEDQGKQWGESLYIDKKGDVEAEEGDWVRVKIKNMPGSSEGFLGDLVENLGDMSHALDDVTRAIHLFHLPESFPENVEKMASTSSKKPIDLKGRKDLRDMPLVTIDGQTAKDFDDAIFVETTKTGFHIVVAIADVSSYVEKGSELDQDAFARGNSTYFPSRVVPMLPESLSNGSCSLNPNVERLCFVCDMNIDFTGDIKDYVFYEAVMKSKARLTYGHAQEIIDGKPDNYPSQVVKNVELARDAAKLRMTKRTRDGSLDLEIPESQIVVDDLGEPVDIVRSERLFAHRLIEEMMLLANICTARFLDEHGDGIYRVHPAPDPDDIKALEKYIWNFGGPKNLTGGILQKKITSALESLEGHPNAQVLHSLTLRSMNQALYSTQNVGHFGLNFTHYSHFTSPIRRYSDLIAHRMIKAVLQKKGVPYTEGELSQASSHVSRTEHRSVKAERFVVSVKKARYLTKYMDQTLDAVVSSVKKSGLFVSLRQFDIDGFISIDDLNDDYYDYDQAAFKLVGKRTGTTYALADSLKVVIKDIDIDMGKISFELEGRVALPKTKKTGPHKGRPDREKRKPTAPNRKRVRS